MPKSEVLLYSRSKFNATAILYKLAICKGKLFCIVLNEIATLLTHYFMKEYFNSFNSIQFFSYIFINISRYVDNSAKRNTPLYSEFYALQDDIFFEP